MSNARSHGGLGTAWVMEALTRALRSAPGALAALATAVTAGTWSSAVAAEALSLTAGAQVVHHVGIYTAPPATVGVPDPAIKACRVPDGPLLGNGDLAVAIGGTATSQTWYISKSDLSQANRGVGAVTVRLRAGAGDAARYRQEQDLAQAEVRSLIPLVGGDLRARSWTADDGDLLVIELSTDGDAAIAADLTVSTHAARAKIASSGPGDVLWASRELAVTMDGKPFTAKAAVAARVLGATVTAGGDGAGVATTAFTIPAHGAVTIVTAVAGGLGSTGQVAAAQDLVGRCDASSLAQRHAAHLAWWRAYWARSSIRLDDDLVEGFYYGALYVLGCSTRAGSVAPGLAGPWQLDGPVCWGNRYTLDYNFEAPWWGVYSCNRPALAEPYYDTILKLIPAGRELAVQHGTKGVLFGVNAHAWGGFTDTRTLNMKGNASLACLGFLMHWRYTRDDAFLVAKAWPLLHELDLFWQDNLTWEESGRRWIIADSSTREGGHDTNPINELAFVRAIYGFLLQTADRLEGQRSGDEAIRITAADRMRWRGYLDHLAAYPTMVEGGKTIFKEAENRTRMSLGGAGDNSDVLFHLFPGEGLDPGDAAAYEVARNTVAALCPAQGKQSWFQANCFPKIYTQAVRAGWPAQSVLDNLRSMLAGKQPYDDRGDHAVMRGNLSIMPPVHGIESVGAIEAIDSMLLQSQGGVIRVFPDWPGGRDAAFQDLLAEGAFRITAACDHGTVGPIELVSEAGDAACWSCRGRVGRPASRRSAPRTRWCPR